MLIELRKFGTTLSSRNDGREAFRVIQPIVKEITEGEDLVFGLFKEYGNKLILKNTTTNKSVQETLELLAEINNIKFNLA